MPAKGGTNGAIMIAAYNINKPVSVGEISLSVANDPAVRSLQPPVSQDMAAWRIRMPGGLSLYTQDMLDSAIAARTGKTAGAAVQVYLPQLQAVATTALEGSKGRGPRSTGNTFSSNDATQMFATAAAGGATGGPRAAPLLKGGALGGAAPLMQLLNNMRNPAGNQRRELGAQDASVLESLASMLGVLGKEGSSSGPGPSVPNLGAASGAGLSFAHEPLAPSPPTPAPLGPSNVGAVIVPFTAALLRTINTLTAEVENLRERMAQIEARDDDDYHGDDGDDHDDDRDAGERQEEERLGLQLGPPRSR